MTIQEVIKKTTEHVDEVYKDGPHFIITPDTPERQMEELADVYHHHLDLNLRALQRAFRLGLEDEICLDSNGWIAFPKIPEDAIETLEVKYGNVKASIQIAEVKEKFLIGYSVKGGPNYGTTTACNIWSWYGLSRREAIEGAIDMFKSYIRSVKDRHRPDGDEDDELGEEEDDEDDYVDDEWLERERQKDEEFCNDLRKCIEHFEEFESDGHQGMLF